MKKSSFEVLLVARRIANYAQDQGVLSADLYSRSTCGHLGAVLADSVLQAGLNYMTVVYPRVRAILESYPNHHSVSSLVSLICDRETEMFLNWRHHEKVNRFESLVGFLQGVGIENVDDLRSGLTSEEFRELIQVVKGVGPKTVDYMSCLVGVDSIAVDRHVRKFAKTIGVENDDYDFLRASFCYAADLLSLPRREFDGWIWRRSAMSV